MRLQVRTIAGLLALAILAYPAFIESKSDDTQRPTAQSSADTLRFAAFGDYGFAGAPEAAVAGLIGSHAPDIIITTGDNSYGAAAVDVNIGQYYSSYIGNYVGSYGTGSVPNRFFPALGNHDYSDGGGVGAYLAYFTLPDSGTLDTSTSGNERYYEFVRGPVHFFAIDSDPSEADGRDSTSTQARWLKARLAASTSPWQVVYFHHPPYSSALHGSDPVMRWPFEDWGADVTFTGHDHVYERLLVDQNKDGKAIPYFITGAGGKNLYEFGAPLPESVVRYSSDHGAMIVEATDTYMNFKFYSVNTSHGTAGLIDDFTITRGHAVEEETWGAVKTFFEQNRD
jgi:tartrate-resistant acid phosphatase type 5